MVKTDHYSLNSCIFTTKIVAVNFCKKIVGFIAFHALVSDQDIIFLSNFLQENLKLSKTKLHMNTSYHPRIDGQAEVVNQCLGAYLRCFAQEQPTKCSSFFALGRIFF